MLKFDNISNEDGLSQSSVFSIVKDHHGYMWFGTADGLNKYNGYEFEVYKTIPGDDASLSSKVVVEVFEDSKNNIWVGTLGGGLNLFDSETEKFKVYKNDKNNDRSISGNDVRVIFEDRKGDLIIGTDNGFNIFNYETEDFTRFDIDKTDNLHNYVWAIEQLNDSIYYCGTYGGLYKWNRNSNKFIRFNNKINDKNSPIHNYTWTIFVENESVLWLGSYLGLTRYDVKKNKFEQIILKPGAEPGSTNNTFFISEFDENNLLLGTRSGLVLFNKNNRNVKLYTHSEFDRKSLSHNQIYDIYKDDTDIIWIGTNIGISKYDKSRNKFNTYDVTTKLNNTNLSNSQINSFAIGKNNDVFIGSANGLNIYNNSLQSFNTLKHNSGKNSISNNDVRALLIKREHELWIGTSGGLDLMNLKNGKFKHYYPVPGDNKSLLSRRVLSLFNDSEDNLWIGSARGLSKFDEEKNCFINYEINTSVNQNYNYVSAICEDDNDNLIFGTYGDGLKVLNKRTNKIKSFKKGNSAGLKDDFILSLQKTLDGKIWIGTNNGLNCFDSANEKFKENYLAGDAILGIVEVGEKKLWISTNNGLIYLNIQSGESQRYNNKGEVQGLQYVSGSYYKDKTGKVYFGGINGYNSFYPDQVKINGNPPDIVISDIEVDGKLIGKTKIITNGDLENNISKINLDHNNRILTVKVAALHYTKSTGNKYSYYLEGFDKDWHNINNRRYIVYTDLPPGEFSLLVKCSNSDGIWSDEKTVLAISVETPPYRTVWAISTYFILISLLIYGIVRYNNIQKEKEITALKRADKLKTEFLAQMSHEIRTPINTILNFVFLIKTDIGFRIGKSLTEYFKIIDGAGERIVRTINLILDMSQFQTNTYDPIIKEFDLVKSVLSRMYIEFKQKAKGKGLVLQLEVNSKNSLIRADEYTVNQIFQNLIDNAIKYTKTGNVKIKVLNNGKDQLVVMVSDTGIGIADDFLPSIFSAFSQEEQGYSRKFEGNGLGLALVKNYCELNEIDISVKSKKGEGTTFLLSFPVINKAASKFHHAVF
ncbi:MAG: hypothetical protein JEY94_13780 [Melioribacteraceae bacterium]|nr:hypothetical protein [Melioribacteraceae bacterium]